MLDAPGVDTWLAGLLAERGRLEIPALRELLWQVQTERSRSGQTLARSLVGRGVLTETEALDYLSELSRPCAPTRTGSQAEAQTRTPRPPSGLGLLPSVWQIGGCVGEYVLRERLGAGGMGTVFLAEHRTTGARLALKTLSRAADEVMLQRFQREAQAQAAVDAHPNVVRVHTAGEVEGRLYLVMDLAGGGDLQHRLRTARPSPEQATRWVIALARGLHHAHEHGVLHRDLKPANVVFDEGGTPKLVDFGLARVAWDSQSLTKTGDVMGTPAYMAPEQASGEGGVDARADVYGLGAILYEALTGRPPFSGGKGLVALLLDVMRTKPEPVRTHSPNTPAAIEAVCMQALAKRPRDRQRTAEALADALEAALTGGDATSGFGLKVAVGGALTLGAVAAICAITWPHIARPTAESGGGQVAGTPPTVEPRDAPPRDAGGADGSRVSEPEPAPAKPRPSPFPDPHPRNPAWCERGSDAPFPTLDSTGFMQASDEAFIDANEKRRSWRRRAAAGDAEAMFLLGRAFAKARDLPTRRSLALAWYLRARAAGSPPKSALEATARAAEIFRALGGQERLRAAAILFAELARKGDHRGCTQLADMLRRGEGPLHEDPARAIPWLEEAVRSEGTSAKPFVRLGALLMWRNGEGDVARAREHLEEVQDMRGGGEALVHLGELARDGRGEPENLERAERLFLEAATGSEKRDEYSLGMLRLGDLLRERGDEDALRRAGVCYRKALTAKPPWFAKYAHGRLWSMHWNDEPSAPDAGEAANHLRTAIKSGNLSVLQRWATGLVERGFEAAKRAQAQARSADARE